MRIFIEDKICIPQPPGTGFELKLFEITDCDNKFPQYFNSIETPVPVIIFLEMMNLLQLFNSIPVFRKKFLFYYFLFVKDHKCKFQ